MCFLFTSYRILLAILVPMLGSPSGLTTFWSRTRNNINHLRGMRSRDFWLFELSTWLHVVAITIIAIFIPILLLERGFDVQTVLLFYVLFHTINVPLNFLAGAMVSSIGARSTIIIAIFCQLLFLISYGFLEPGSLGMLILVATAAAAYDALYFSASMFLFMDSTQDKNNSGTNTGIFYAVVRSAAIIGPLIGSGILLLSGSQAALIGVVIAFFVLSLIPLFCTTKENTNTHRILPLRSYIKSKFFWGNHLSLGLYKIHETVGQVLWPIFIFLYFGSLESVAFLAILVPVVALSCSYFSGLINLRHRYRAIALGAAAVALIWLGRILFENDTWYYASVVLVGLFGLLMQVPIDANIFRAGKETNELTASVVRNAFSMGTKALIFLLLWLTSISYQFGFLFAFVALVLLTSLNVLRQHMK